MEHSMALLALVLSIYQEARGESIAGMQVVADTVYTRVHDPRWASNYTEVVLEAKQFTWVTKHNIKEHGDLIDLQARILQSKHFTKKDRLAYRQATQIATRVLSQGYKPKYRFTHFYSGKAPIWAKHRSKVKIGNHTFIHIKKETIVMACKPKKPKPPKK